jgi:RNA polymerase sigma-70 factor (ECF subfamily)
MSHEFALVQELLRGDRASFRHVVQTYERMVRSVAMRIVGNREDAEDVAQIVFLTLYKKAATFRGDALLSTWLYRVAVNRALNVRRRRKWERVLGFFDGESDEDAAHMDRFEGDGSLRPDRQLERAEQGGLLQQALDKLPENQRTAMILHKYEGISYEEIALILKVSLSAVESLMHRAKGSLQKQLQNRLDEFRD